MLHGSQLVAPPDVAPLQGCNQVAGLPVQEAPQHLVPVAARVDPIQRQAAWPHTLQAIQEGEAALPAELLQFSVHTRVQVVPAPELIGLSFLLAVLVLPPGKDGRKSYMRGRITFQDALS